MNSKRYLSCAALAAVLVCAAPAYSQILGGNATGALGGTLGGSLGGLAGSGQAMGSGTLGGTFDSDAVGRIRHGATSAVGRTRGITDHAKDKVASSTQRGDKATEGTDGHALDLEGALNGAGNATGGMPITKGPAANSQSATTEPPSDEPRGLDVAGALSGTGQASTNLQEPARNSSTTTALTQQPKSHALDADAGSNGNANASVKPDSTQLAQRSVDASASADANVSATRR